MRNQSHGSTQREIDEAELFTELKKALAGKKIPDKALANEIRKTIKNVSIRPTREQAKCLLLLRYELYTPKARIVKLCLDRGLEALMAQFDRGLGGIRPIPESAKLV